MNGFGVSGRAIAIALAGLGLLGTITLGPKVFNSEAGAQAIAIQAPNGAPLSFADLIERVEPAVVSVYVKTEQEVSPLSDADRFFDLFRNPPGFEDDSDESTEGGDDETPRTRPGRSLGSGFLISADGLIVTNNHVIDGATEIEVTLHDDRELECELVGQDPSTDLAVLRIKDPGSYPYVRFGSSDTMRKGDWVVAVGNPFGFGGTATAGILSADGRDGGRANPYTDYLQIDASINRGNSGGPTFDLYGNVIGVNTAIISPTGGSVGIGFAIPAELAKEVTDILIRDGKVERGYLGVTIGDFTDDMAEARGLQNVDGAIIGDVNVGSPAELGGLERGDVIIAVNGKKVTDASTTTRMVGRLRANTENTFDIYRDNTRQTVRVKVGVRPEDPYAAERNRQSSSSEDDSRKGTEAESFGVSFRTIESEDRERLGLRDSDSGVVITDIEDDSPLYDLGLRKGLAILEVNNQTITNATEFERAIDSARRSGRTKVLMAVRAPGGTAYSTLDLEAE